MPIYDRSNEAGFDPARHARWQVRWRDGDHKQRKRAFNAKAEAVAFEKRLLTSGALRHQTRTVAEQWERWRDTRQSTGPGNRANIQTIWNEHLERNWAHRRIAGIDHSEVAAWVGMLSQGATPSIARNSIVQLRSILEQAVRDEVIDRNPAEGITVKVVKQHQSIYLSREDLDNVAKAMGQDDLLVYLLGLSGMRWGELVGLQNRDLDLERRRVSVMRTISEVRGVPILKAGTKNSSTREVTAPLWLLEALHGQKKGRPTDPLLQTESGGVRRHGAFYGRWRRQVWDGLGIQMRVHDLRHTAASLMIASGADVKTVQRQLGHKTATMTLDRYGHLWDSALDDLSERMK